MATADQRDAVRYDLGSLTSVQMPDAEINLLYTRAEASYSGQSDAQEAWVRFMAVRNLKAQAAKRTDYKQNQSQEWLSQLFTQLEKLEKQFYGDLQAALEAGVGLVRFGGLRRAIPHLVEFPQDYPFIQGTVDADDVSRLEP